MLQIYLLLPMEPNHLSFYGNNNISPVRQDISDLDKHFQRREALYRQLGILPQAIAGRTVLEVGPGSGQNALYTASLRPSRFVLIEGNPLGATDTKTLLRPYNAEILQTRLENWTPEPFDFVFCEGLLSGVENPTVILGKLMEATRGALVVTVVDHISHFSETIRRALAQVLIDPEATLEVKVNQLLPVFTPHLKTLKGMSRRYDDWIIDNLIHPGSIIPLFNAAQVIESLGMEYYAGSPHFVTDWRWYKEATKSRNKEVIRQYWANAHNMLDYRKVTPVRVSHLNESLYALCSSAREYLAEFEKTREEKYFHYFKNVVEAIYDSEYSAGLKEAIELLENPNPQAIANAKNFGAWFGRGQQYLSFVS